jgi:hypothetical protein
MKRKMLSLLFLFVLVSISCSNKPENKVAAITSDSIPEGAIPFEYGRTKKIILKGILDDSSILRIGFDIGGGNDNWLILSDSLKDTLGKKYHDGSKAKLSIGNYQDSLNIYYKNKNNLKSQDTIVAVMNWHLFKDRIIKISYQKKYLQIIDSIDNLSGYDEIKIEKVPDGCLKIPVSIYLQGKVIYEKFWFDTGCNVAIYLEKQYVDKYKINIANSQTSSASTISEITTFESIKSDSIKVGNQIISNQDVYFGNVFKNFPALIGNSFFENFDIILDLKNFVLYLKPIEV